MIAIDTNVIVRILVNDDQHQTKRAANVLQTQQVLITKTVLVETEWVLRHTYKLNREIINHSMCQILGLDNVNVEDSENVNTALKWHKEELDFADAIHLASSNKAKKFMTFDQDLVKKSKSLNSLEVLLP